MPGEVVQLLWPLELHEGWSRRECYVPHLPCRQDQTPLKEGTACICQSSPAGEQAGPHGLAIPVSGGLGSACRVHFERLSSCLHRDSKLHLNFI